MEYDWQVLISRKNWLVLIGGLAICYIGMGTACGFFPMFLMIILAKIAITKIEEPIGKFLFTLPFTCKSCAYELYAYPLIGGMLIGIMIFAATSIYAPADWPTHLIETISSIGTGLVMISVMIPVFVMFGTQSVGIFFGVVLAAVLGGGIMMFGDMDLAQIMQFFSNPWIGWALAALLIVILAISWTVTLKALNNKTF